MKDGGSMQRPQAQPTIRPYLLYALFGAIIFGVGLWLARWALISQAAEPSNTAPAPPTSAATILQTLSPTMPVTPSLTASTTLTPTETSTLTPWPTDTPSSTPTIAHTETPTEQPTLSFTPAPLPTPDGVCRALNVPILMYHYVSIPPAGADSVRRDLSVTPQRFEEQLLYLREAGYTCITLYDLALALQIGQPLPAKPVVITFDDGYRDNYTQAFPLLRQYGFAATFFLITKPIDEGQADYVTWEQVIEMDAAGMNMEAHGYTHSDLRGRDVDYLVWQVLGAKEAIEARTHKPVRFFAYPSGKYDEQTMRVLHSANYWGAVTITNGITQRSERVFQLDRVRVRGSYTASKLAAVLSAYEDQTIIEEALPCTMTPLP